MSDALIGTLVDMRYRVSAKLARGGMSTVYLAIDQRLDREVALKVLHPHLSGDPQFLDRLGSEAKAAARLSHPHVVAVLDQGQDQHTAYLVMEYIKGHTLRDVMKDKGALTPRLALAYLDAIVEGLAAAHRAGLIHRDVKPENVLLSDTGHIKIGDFGLSRAVTTTTSTGALIGTVAYLSPELVLGRAADARSDIYSVGIMLFEMLTGQQPFTGEIPLQVAYQHANSTVPAASTLVPGLAQDLDELVLWCTAKDPENRPVDADALLGELRHVRATLSNSELDLGSQGTSNTEVLRPNNHRTEVLGTRTQVLGNGGGLGPGYNSEATQVISGGQSPTTVLGQGVRWQQPYSPMVPEVHDHPGNGSGEPRPSKRELKKAAKAQERDRVKAAATPVASLRHGNSRRRGAIWIVVIVLLALLASSAGWFFGLGPGAEGTIPDVRNKTVSTAQQQISAAGMHNTTQEVFDDNVLAGMVVASDPPTGTRIRKFQNISLLVSKGPQLFALPTLTSKQLDVAKDELNNAEMALGTISEVYDDVAAAGVVLKQSPAAGKAVRHGTPVALTVSKGPQPINVPDVTGQEQETAVGAITDAGLKAVVAPEREFSKTVPEGHVISQEPANGTLFKGEGVTLTISKGPKMIKVPNVIGKQIDDARQILEDLGFKVTVEELLGGFFGSVRFQEPGNGEAPEGSTIHLSYV